MENEPNPYAPPRALPVAGAPERFAPSLRKGTLAIWWLAAVIAARSVVMVIELLSYWGHKVLFDHFLLTHVLLRLVGKLGILVGGILFLSWVASSARNARILRPDAKENRAPWVAVAWFLVPLANLIMAPKVLADLVRASGAKSGAIWAWLSWLLVLVSIFCGLIVAFAKMPTWDLRVFFEVFGDLPFALAILSLRKVVRVVAAAQGELASR